jgi:hypothetical protein
MASLWFATALPTATHAMLALRFTITIGFSATHIIFVALLKKNDHNNQKVSPCQN